MTGLKLHLTLECVETFDFLVLPAKVRPYNPLKFCNVEGITHESDCLFEKSKSELWYKGILDWIVSCSSFIAIIYSQNQNQFISLAGFVTWNNFKTIVKKKRSYVMEIKLEILFFPHGMGLIF